MGKKEREAAAAAAASPDAPASAAPGTEDKKAQKTPRMFHPVLKVDDKKKATVKIDAIPTDFDKKLHKPLRRHDFKDESTWLEIKADELEAKVAQMRKDAADYRTMGSAKDRAKAKKLKQMQSRIAELKKQLSEQGVDVDALLSDD